MNASSSHIYNTKNAIDRKWTISISVLIILAAIVVSFFADNLGNATPYAIIALMGFGLFVNRILPICVYIPSLMFNVELGVIQYPVLAILLFTCFAAYSNKITINKTVVFMVIILFVAASTLLGYNANAVTAIVTLISFFTFFCFCDIANAKRLELIELSLFGSGLAMVVFMLIQIINGTASYLWGDRLAYEGSVRALANAIAFSVYFSFCKLTVLHDRKKSVLSKITWAFTLIAGLYILFMTYSRGVLLAVVLACIVTVFYTLKGGMAKRMTGLLVVVVFAIVCINSFGIDIDLLTHNVSSGNGRFQLWTYFTKDMVSGGIFRTIFGYGPGEFSRISQNSPFAGLYAHSVYMDALFSFGFSGFIFLMYQVLKTIRSALKSKNAYVIGLSILTAVMYISHGISSSYQFYLMLGLCSALSVASSQLLKTKSATGVYNE